MPTPKCHRLWRPRLFTPDTCPCSWGTEPVAMAFMHMDWSSDREWHARMMDIGALFVESP